MIKLDNVFGIASKPVLSYVERQQVDGKFVDSLSTDHHIVIYGSSKQGKTALRQKHITEDRCKIIRCNPRSSLESIYQSILRDTGIVIDAVETTNENLKTGVKAKWGFKAMLPFFGGTDAEGEISGEAGKQSSVQSNYVGYDLADCQAVTELLSKVQYNKFVILENFHYLPHSVQRDIAFDLKTFHEVSVRFIILGIWKEANYLQMHNGDLQDRISETPVEPWEDSDFDRVISNGCAHLNIGLSGKIVNEFKLNAYGNIGMLQEFLKTYCRICGILEPQTTFKMLHDESNLQKTFIEKVDNQKGRLAKVLQTISGMSRVDTHTDDPLILPYYLVKVLLTTSIKELTEGITKQALLEKIREIHHRDLKETIRMSDLSNLLKRIPALQQDIQPPFLYYDTNQKRLKVVDATQFFVLARIERAELLEEIPFPLDRIAEDSSVDDNSPNLFQQNDDDF